MKWFQHQTDASDDIKIKRLEDRFGLQGYAVFFKILEKIAKEGKNCALDIKKYPTDFLAKDFKTEKKVFDECLTFMSDLGLIVLKKDLICAPNMKKYASNWTKRKDRGTTEGRQRDDGVPTAQEEKRREEIRKEEKREGISSFEENKGTGKKPFFQGLEVRKSNGKLWVIPKGGGKWLEFAGKEKDIEWVQK